MKQAMEENGERLTQRDRTITSLESELRKLEGSIETLNNEIVRKGEELVKLKSDSKKNLRYAPNYNIGQSQ